MTPPSHEKTVGRLYLVLAMITVGSTVVASKTIAGGLAPFTATALRFGMALPLFLLLLAATRTSWPKISGRDGLLLVAQAGAGSVGYTALLITGTGLTSAADAGVIIGTLPMVAALLSIVVLRERPGARLLLSIGVAVTGVLVVSWPTAGGGDRSLVGNGLIVAAVFCEAIFILLNKRLQKPLPALIQSTAMVGIGFVISLAVALAIDPPLQVAWQDAAVLATAYYAVVPTTLGFLLWYAGAAKVSGSEASLFTAVAPVSAVLMAGVLLGDVISLQHWVGVACVLLAVAVAAL